MNKYRNSFVVKFSTRIIKKKKKIASKIYVAKSKNHYVNKNLISGKRIMIHS